jgi:hypothetical protein
MAKQISVNPMNEAPRTTNIEVTYLTGDELAAHYQANPGHKELDQENGYKRVLVSTWYAFDTTSEADLSSGQPRNVGVHGLDTVVLIDGEDIESCSIKRVFSPRD